MRIATSTLFSQQAAAIDNLVAQQAAYGAELSTGKRLNQPSDDPTHIAQDLDLRAQVALGNGTVQNIANTSAQLTTADGALASLVSVLQKARALAVSGASDTVTVAQRQAIAQQVDGLLGEAVGFANSQYGGTYLFAGTASPAQAPVQTSGSPTSGVTFGGNLAVQTQQYPGGQNARANVTLREAFNYASTDGSPDVFQTLVALRDTLAQGTIVDESENAVNKGGTVVTGATTLNSANFATALTPDSSGNVAIDLSSAQAPNGVTLTFAPGTTVAGVMAAINGSGTGVTATFDAKAERIALSSVQGPFLVKDVPSAGATNAGNLTSVFNITSQADTVNTLSREIGDVDHVLTVATSARAALGSSLQRLQALSSAQSASVLNDTQVQSGLEDADIAKVVAQFSQAQTALQAAYGTTTKLETKSLFDYLT